MSAARARPADVFAAIGDPNRRRILELLAVRDRTVGELATELGIAQPSATQHLAVLRETGLAGSTRVGTRSVYAITPAALAEVAGWIASIGGGQVPEAPAHQRVVSP